MARSGLTTGTCATAATSAAAQLLIGNNAPAMAEVSLPRSSRLVALPIARTWSTGLAVCATVVKPDNDDPDVTQGAAITVCLEQLATGVQHEFVAGPGVGTITRPGLAFGIGEAAINPVPRQMMAQVLDQTGLGPCRITVSVENGEAMAAQTFNPRLGIVGGISILGTTGIVRPYCRKAMCDAIRVNLAVVRAQSSVTTLVPGNIGFRSATDFFACATDALVEVGNEWEAGLRAAQDSGFAEVRLVGHPGKLAKLAVGEFYTHSHHSTSALPVLQHLAQELGIIYDPAQATAEGFLAQLADADLRTFTSALCERIAQGVRQLWLSRPHLPQPLGVIHLIRMDGRPWC